MKVKSETRSDYEKNLVATMQTGTQAQKEKAFCELYKRHHEALYFHCLKKFRGNKEEAEDTVQEVFTRIHLKIDQFNPEVAVFSTWLYKVANNFIVDQIRKTNVEVLSYDRLAVNSSDNSDSSGTQAFQIEDKSTLDNHEAFLVKERKQMVSEAINTLKNVKARRVMRLVYIEELLHEDVSRMLNMPIGTIKALVHRAKDAIKIQLKEMNFEYNA